MVYLTEKLAEKGRVCVYNTFREPEQVKAGSGVTQNMVLELHG